VHTHRNTHIKSTTITTVTPPTTYTSGSINTHAFEATHKNYLLASCQSLLIQAGGSTHDCSNSRLWSSTVITRQKRIKQGSAL
jgi:hypothetical protein